MALHACLNNKTVAEIVEITSYEEYESYSKKYSTVLDISNYIITPQVGWILAGYILSAPVNHELSLDEQDAYQQKAQRLFGLKILPIAVDKLGARNLKLSRDGIPADVATLASQMASIKVLLEGGALKTVRGLCVSIKPMHPNHTDILDEVIAEISNFLESNGWQ